ncbi:MAG: lysozyme [Oleispira sp.]|nr:lysozyme [Oleispira sp.]
MIKKLLELLFPNKPEFKTIRAPKIYVNVSIIREFEGLRLEAYLPTPNDVPTIGYGHTKGVFLGQVITENQANHFLGEDVKWAIEAVEKYVTVPININQKSALVSFTFNVGATAFRKSTLVRKLNAGDYSEAAFQFLRWDKQKGKTLKGLTRRRLKEKALFMRLV